MSTERLNDASWSSSRNGLSSLGWTMHTPPKAACSRTLVILGEAPGADEEAQGRPFVGASGHLLRTKLAPDAGIDLDQWHILNVFSARPPANNLDAWTANKTELKKLGIDFQHLGPPIRNRYVLPEHQHHVEETRARLEQLKPDFILALGGVSLWLLTGDAAVGTYRGTIFKTPWGSALATYHPAAILRQYSFLPIAWADMRKVALHLEGKLPAPLRRTFYVNPTFAEIGSVYARFMANPEWTLGVDIETGPKTEMMTTIAFSTPTLGICLPIWNKETGQSFWPSVQEEARAWRWIERFAALPNPKVLQNATYDLQWLLDGPLAIRLKNVADDTSVLQHAIQPELPKALGTLSSLYLSEPSWKQMRVSNKEQKADE